MLEDRLLSRKEAAKLLGIAEATLLQWRYKKKGPKGVKVGQRVKYRLSDLNNYVANLK